MTWKQFLILVGTIGAMVAIVPLMVWGGTGSLSRAWDALRQYLKIMAAIVAIGGGVGLLMVLAEFMSRT